MGVTKTDYMRGIQCPKMLWLDKHMPEKRVIPPNVQQRLDDGNAFGDKAMGMFGPYVETTAYREDGKLDYVQMIKNTKTLLESGENVVCEGAFAYFGCYCATDILKKVPGGRDLYEVKNSTEVKPQFIKDIGFQCFVARKSGVRIQRMYIVYRNADAKENESPFLIQDVTEEADAFARTVGDHIFRLGRIKAQRYEVEQEMGPQCDEPYECWYKDYCKSLVGKPRDWHVTRGYDDGWRI
ncbi:MAG: hypothetical protein J6D30_05840 [Clostridia bacterium]|nr:hypothetical protein [Clostridia bacterium]